MVGHESVDPKPQAKADQVTGVMLFSVLFVGFFLRSLSFIATTREPITLLECISRRHPG